MRNSLRTLALGASAALLAGIIAAFAANITLFSSTIGDVVFPFSPPPLTGGPGAIDNMTIGATTPAAGTFTSVTNRGTALGHQITPAAKTVSATLTTIELQTALITVSQGAAGASALQLPLATAMDTAFPNSIANDSFDFSVVNISTNAAEPASLTTNTGWTLVGDMDLIANSASTTKSAGRFRARKTATGAWTLYRLS